VRGASMVEDFLYSRNMSGAVKPSVA